MENVEQSYQTITTFINTAIQWTIAHGFQVLGALVLFYIGVRLARWAGRQIRRIATVRGLDQTLMDLASTLVQVVIVAVLIIITLGNLGIEVTPFVALLGAGTLGVTMALQGVLSNMAAGVAIILSRPFRIGHTIAVAGQSGVVHEIGLPATVIQGEDGEKITIPNKHIVGQVIVNSDRKRVVEYRIALAADQDVTTAITAVRQAFDRFPDLAEAPCAQVGLHEFTYGGILLGLRFWVPSRQYFERRYAVNRAGHESLRTSGVRMLAISGTSLPAPALVDRATNSALDSFAES